MCQVFRSGLARRSGLEACGICSEDVTGLPSTKLSEGLTEPEGSTCKASRWVVAIGRRPVLHLGFPLGCVNVFLIWLLTSSSWSSKEQGGSPNVFCDFLGSHSDIPPDPICNKQVTKSTPYSRGWRLGSTF